VAHNLERRGLHILSAPAIEANDLTVLFENSFALRNVSFVLPRGEHLAVVGPNGAGKTTLFHTISGILKPNSGSVDIYGHSPGGHVCIAYVPQRSRVDWSFPVSVLEVVMMGRIREIGMFKWPRKADWAFVRQALQRVGLSDHESSQIGDLSSGQQQRVFLAQALAQEAELVLLDEPLSGLDLPSQESIFEILDELKKDGVAVAVATHDLDLAAERFDRVMLLNRELISFGTPDEALTTPSLLNAFGGHLHRLDDQRGLVVLSDDCEDPEKNPE
jgi:ABC-type Mn2+/Zn2+ transport system ATPase subunit